MSEATRLAEFLGLVALVMDGLKTLEEVIIGL